MSSLIRRSSRLLGLVALSVILAPARGLAQAPASQGTASACGTDAAMRRRLGAGYDAWWQQYRAQVQARDAALRAAPHRPASTAPAGPRFIVPVTVHIIHDGPQSDISDAQVEDAIRILNEDYQAHNTDTSAVFPYFKARVGNANLEFRLARRDPQGNCTNGITRTFSELTNSADENVKQLIAWDHTRYLNIWVVKTISFGAAGYAYLPCWVGGPDDGIVILNGYIGSIGRASPYNSRALTHEVGHYLGLPHTWGGTNNPGPGLGNCADDDGVADTPNDEGSPVGVCNLQAPACPGSGELYANVQNYMDYSYCSRMFTTGQAALMNEGIAADFNCRVSLSTPANLQFTGVADGLNLPPCAPQVAIVPAQVTSTFDLLAARVCAGDSARLRAQVSNVSTGTALQYLWTLPGGSPATSTRPSPAVRYAAPGMYPVTVTVTSAGGSTTSTRADFVRVVPTSGGLVAPTVTSFENPQFPLDPTDPLKNWEIIAGATGLTWEYTGAAAALGQGAVRIALRNNQGAEHQLVSPAIEIPTALNSAQLRFQVAYAQRNSSNLDQLRAAYSLDCGRSWVTRFIRSGAALASGNPTRVAGVFVPTASDWHDFALPLGNLSAGARILVRFAVTGDQGNALYLDDLRVAGTTPLGMAAELPEGDMLTLAPNPAPGGEATIRVVLPAGSGAASLRVYDATGRLVAAPYALPAAAAGQVTETSLAHCAGSLGRGLYLVELTTADGQRRSTRTVVE